MKYKTCVECHREINGRSDKKFCDDGCRNTYHNRQNSLRSNNMKRVNCILKKNRKIIKDISPSYGRLKLPAKSLELKGFDFNYVTKFELKENTFYQFCYDVSYTIAEDGSCELYIPKLV